MKKSNKKVKSNNIKINRFTMLIVAFLFGLIIYKLVYVAVASKVDGIDLKVFALSRTTANKTIEAKRGSIYDINGEVLAQDVRSYTVIAYLAESRTTDMEHPQHVVDKEMTAEKIAPFINMSKEDGIYKDFTDSQKLVLCNHPNGILYKDKEDEPFEMVDVKKLKMRIQKIFIGSYDFEIEEIDLSSFEDIISRIYMEFNKDNYNVYKK